MQFSENWLRTMVNPNITSDELSHLLTMAGLEVEEIEPVAPPFNNVVVAEICEIKKHPDADRLNICQVDVGTGTLLNIVCGAPNIRVGMKVACAMAGAVLPPGADGKPFEIKVGKLRGVESQGMLCSAKELKLSDEASGLLNLSSNALVGQDFRDYYLLNDLKFTIKLTPNKADCLSVLGVAREVSALTGTALTLPAHRIVHVTLSEILPVKVDAPDLCGRFSGRIIRGVNAKAPTPEWMKQRLERSGQRSISALVDISNYVMLELGRPSHVFDLDKIHGSLEVRWGKTGESLKLLNGNTINIDASVGVIADQREIESLAGIMGGDSTAVGLETTNIYLEAAFWWPQAIQGRARKYNFSTDASHRYERGVDFASTVEHIERITSLIVEICGGEEQVKVGPVDDQIINVPQRTPVKMRTERAVKVIGVPFTDAQIANIFSRLGLQFTHEAGIFYVTPPTYRFDIEIEEDLIEEVVRVYGYENIPSLPPVAANKMLVIPENHRSLFTLRRQIADQDYQEVVNYSFVDQDWEKDFCANLEPIKLKNPIASQMSVMRTSLIPSLVANTKYNLNRKINRIRIFELATVYLRDDKIQDGPFSLSGYKQVKMLSGLAYGSVVEEQWGQNSKNIDFFDVKADLENLYLPKSLKFTKADHPALHPGRSAFVICDGIQVGVIGELHPKLQQKYDLPLAPIVFEVEVTSLQELILPKYKEISKFQTVTRDLAFVVKNTVSVQEILDVFYMEMKKNSACKIVQSIVLFDEYRGKGLEQEEKSLAFRIGMQDTQATLQDEAVAHAIDFLVLSVTQNIEARLR